MVIEREIESIFPENKTVIRIKIYDSVQECFEAHLGCKLSDIGEMGGYDADGKEYKFTPQEAMGNMKEMGCWGFCNDKSNIPILHVWWSPECQITDLIHLLAHERGHTLRPWHSSEEKEEMKAERYGKTARFAYQVAMQLMNIKPPLPPHRANPARNPA